MTSDNVGRGLSRREDRPLLQGKAEYTDDLSAPRMTHLAFARSTEPHATIRDVDVSGATEVDGVLAAYTWDDVQASDTPGVLPISAGGLDAALPGHPVLARDRVRYEGQPVAAVVAEERYAARDGADAIEVEYDSLDVVTDPREATADDAPTLYESAPDNVVNTSTLGDAEETDEAFAEADEVVELDLENNRLIPNALEPRAALARWSGGDLTVEMTSQSPHGHQGKLAHTLGVPEGKIRVIAPDVGGGFGHKGHHHPGEAMAAWAAREVDRPVKWTATRSENYLAGAHGRDHRTHAELALDRDGTIRGLRVETYANVGGYGLGGSPMMPGWYGSLLSSQYAIPAIHAETKAVMTSTQPIHSYRGAGRPEAIYVIERVIDVAARELDLDPVDVRRTNLIDPDDFPYETPVGANYDSGDYEPALDQALETVDYEALRSRERDEDGRYLGVGVACYTESTGGGYESGLVRVHPDGGVTAYAGTHSHGQGHETTYAQIVADELDLPMDAIEIEEGDSDAVPHGTGTFGSRSTITGGNAVAESAQHVLAKAREIAAHELDADVEDVAYEAGEFRVEGDTEDELARQEGADMASGGDRTVSFEDVAGTAYGWGVPEGMDPGLEATTFYEPDGTAYTFGTHVAVVAVDPKTGEVEIERYLGVDDCGERVNPTLVEGQVHGGVAQGIGQARYESVVFADDGTLATDELIDYAMPRAADVPEIETGSTVTPSPRNELGVKGIGEAGTMAAPPAVVNAVVDALAPLGIRHVDMPLTEERVWRAIEERVV